MIPFEQLPGPFDVRRDGLLGEHMLSGDEGRVHKGWLDRDGQRNDDGRYVVTLQKCGVVLAIGDVVGIELDRVSGNARQGLG